MSRKVWHGVLRAASIAAVAGMSLLAGDPAFARGDTLLNVPENWFVPLTVPMLQEQLDLGVDINELDTTGSSVLVRAGNAMAGEDVWRYLVAHGARITEHQLEDRTAIFWVTKGSTPAAVRFILAQPGVDINALDESGRNAFAHAARMQPDLEVYRAMTKAGIDVKNKDKNGRTAMHEAAMRSRYVHLFDYFRSVGLRYDALDENGWDPFLNAAWRNPNLDVVMHLAHHANVKRVGKDGLNAAMLASENNPSAAVFNWLLAQGLRVDGRDGDGATALIRSGRNSAEVAAVLLAMGQDVNAADSEGTTAFLNSARATTEGPALARLLAKAGANVRAVDKNGANALMIALANGNVYKGGPAMIRLLMGDYGLRPVAKLADGSTPLTIAARANQSAEILRLLTAAGADVNAADGDGATPLMIYAAKGYNTGAIDYLIGAGADRGRRDRSGKTAADLAKDNPDLNGRAILDRLAAR